MQDLYHTKVATPTMTKAEALRQVQLSFINGGQKSVAGKDNRGAQAMTNQNVSGTAYHVNTSAPFAHPYYWAPFILMGNWL